MNVEVRVVRPIAVGGPGLTVLAYDDAAAGFHAATAVNLAWLRDACMEGFATFDGIASADPVVGPVWGAAKARATAAGLPSDELLEATRRAALGA